MSVLDVSDPYISMAHSALKNNDPLRWFLLTYGSKPNQLSLFASGTGDLEELRSHIDLGTIQYGVFREQVSSPPICISLVIIPDSVGGVRRARALAHARVISSMFKIPRSLTVTNPGEVTIEAVRNALHLPPRTAAAFTEIVAPIPIPAVRVSSLSPDANFASSSHPQEDSGKTSHSSESPTPPRSPTPSSTFPRAQVYKKPPPPLSMSSEQQSPELGHKDEPPGTGSPQARVTLDTTVVLPLSPPPEYPYPLSRPTNEKLTQSSSIDNVMEAHDLKAHPSSFAKVVALHSREPDPESMLKPGPVPEQNLAESPQELTPAFKFDDEESSEAHFGVGMHGPLAEIGKANIQAPQTSTLRPRSAVGTIPDEHSIHSNASAGHEISPVARDPPPRAPPKGNKPPALTLVNGSGNKRSPAQEEAARTRDGWVAKEKRNETPLPPLPSQSKPPPPPKDPPKNEALRSLGRQALSPKPENIAPQTRRRRATEDAGSYGTHQTMEDTHRRVVSHGMSKSPTSPQQLSATRSLFLERATPETLAEEQKLVRLEEERRRRAVERARRQLEEREEEEARERAFAERKERESTRRWELARQGEIRRAEERKREAAARAEREAKEARERAERGARERIARVKARRHMEGCAPGAELMTGFVTLEMASAWRRRYFKLSTDSWRFYRSDEDTITPLQVIELASVSALREWNDGYEELEAIPHSFVVELKDGDVRQFFADTAEDKELLTGLLFHAARL